MKHIPDVDHSDYDKIAKEIANTVAEKNVAYGNSFQNVGKFLRILYPNGIKVEDYDNAMFITRLLDKLGRVSRDPHSLNEDAFADIAGYAILAIAQHRQK